jgi:hypothetical protein
MAQRRITDASADDAAPAAKTTPARKPRTRVRKVTPDEVALRAYLMSLSEPGASPEENWLRAEQELLAS